MVFLVSPPIPSDWRFFLFFLFRKRWLTLSLWLRALLTCYSRVYLGVHYPGDFVGRDYCGVYCHSMGGGIGAAVMEHYPSLFDKAVLSAPMIAPRRRHADMDRTYCHRRALRLGIW